MALHLERPTRPTSFPLACPKVGNMGIARHGNSILGLKEDGTCIYFGESEKVANTVSTWNNIVAIDVDKCGTFVGLKSDGTCVCTCANPNIIKWLSELSNVVCISACHCGVEVVKSDGTCDYRTTTWNVGSTCYQLTGLENIVSCGAGYTVAVFLKSDGTCVANAKYNTQGEANVYRWSDIVAVAAGECFSMGLKSDGTCVAAGNGSFVSAIQSWRDIVSISTGEQYAIGLKSDGTCVSTGVYDVSDWSDVIKVQKYGVGIKSDGTCLVAGSDIDISDWNLYAYKKALMISLAGLNFTNYNAVNSISVSGVEPENTKRRLAFKVGDKWNKLAISNGAATLSALPTQTLTADSVLEEGNTVAEVVSATSIPDFAGKIVYPAIALYASESAAVMPTIGLKANATTTTEKYTQEGYSQEYHLSDAPVSVVSLKADITAKGAASAVVTVSLKNGDTWGDYIDLEKAIGQKATDIKFKTVYTVTKTDGSESASLNNVTCTYTTSGNKVTNKAADVVTVTKEFTNDLVYIHAYVKHKPLKDAKINVYAALRPTPKKRDMKQIGTGSGETQTVKVDDVGINQDTLRVYYDGKAVYDFDYNTETSEITFKAAVGVVVSASYEYGWKAADWLPMTQGLTQNNDSGNDTTEYTYTVPAHKDALTVTAIRYELLRPTGHVSDEVIGIGTGTRQIIKLPHFAKKETIVCSGAWSYDYESRLVTVVADKGTEIKISYDWIAEQPEVISIGAGWAD